jgi:8-oxo-dGTP pyrophosphatase MutT (NUDIX family)
VSDRPAGIRVKAIAVIWRGRDVLLSFAIDPASGLRYGRFLGGGVEVGERAEDTVRRELREEIGVAAGAVSRLGVVENIFTLDGRTEHEVIFVCAATLADPSAYDESSFAVSEAVCDGPAEWVPVERLLHGEIAVYPPELLAMLGAS